MSENRSDYPGSNNTQPLRPANSSAKGKLSPLAVALICAAVAVVAVGITLLVVNSNNDNDANLTANTAEAAPASIDHSPSKRTPAQQPPKKLKVASVRTFRNIPPEAGNTYVAQNLIDGDPATCWAVHSDDPDNMDMSGIAGPTFKFARPVKLSHIVIRNGYAKNKKRFVENSRPSAYHIFNADYTHPSDFEMATEFLYDGDVTDTPAPQILKIDPDLESNNNITTINFSFWPRDIIHGTRWDDLSISEIEFWGWQ